MRIVRDEDFVSLYANNVALDGTVWDLQAVFGGLEKNESGQPIIKQHTMISMPWAVAKIACFHLALQIIVFERNHGPLRLPANVLPLLGTLKDGARNEPRIMAILEALIGPGNPELIAAQRAILASQAAIHAGQSPDETFNSGDGITPQADAPVLKRYWFVLYDPITRKRVREPVCSLSAEARIHQKRAAMSDGHIRWLTLTMKPNL